jgi:hypothetical protein
MFVGEEKGVALDWEVFSWEKLTNDICELWPGTEAGFTTLTYKESKGCEGGTYVNDDRIFISDKEVVFDSKNCSFESSTCLNCAFPTATLQKINSYCFIKENLYQFKKKNLFLSVLSIIIVPVKNIIPESSDIWNPSPTICDTLLFDAWSDDTSTQESNVRKS